MRSLHLDWFFSELSLKQTALLLRELFGKTPQASATFSSGHSPVQTFGSHSTNWTRAIGLTTVTLMDYKTLLKTDGNIWQLSFLLNSGFSPTPVAPFPMFQDLGIGKSSPH